MSQNANAKNISWFADFALYVGYSKRQYAAYYFYITFYTKV